MLSWFKVGGSALFSCGEGMGDDQLPCRCRAKPLSIEAVDPILPRSREEAVELRRRGPKRPSRQQQEFAMAFAPEP